MENKLGNPNTKKYRWPSLIMFIVGLFIWQGIKQYDGDRYKEKIQRIEYENEQRQENQLTTIKGTNGNYTLPFIAVDIDSLKTALNNEKKLHHIQIVGFDKQDSLLILFRDSTLAVDTPAINSEFTNLFFKYHLNTASNVTSLIVYKRCTVKQMDNPNFSPGIEYLYSRVGSKIYNSYDSLGAFKH